MTSLAEPPTSSSDRLLIISAVNLGLAHATNTAVYAALDASAMTSAAVMIPCPWAREAAAHYRGQDVGVALTLNSELDLYRWGPATVAPSLLDGDGGFPRTLDDLWDHADIDEVRRECRAQIERAVLWGFAPSYLDVHLGAMQVRPELFDVLLEMADDYQMPLCLPDAETEEAIGFPLRRLALDEGVVSADHHIPLPGDATVETVGALLSELQPGVTQIALQPATDTPELRALTPSWQHHVNHAELLRGERSIRAQAESLGITLTSWRELRAGT